MDQTDMISMPLFCTELKGQMEKQGMRNGMGMGNGNGEQEWEWHNTKKELSQDGYNNKSVQLHMISTTAWQYDIGNPWWKLRLTGKILAVNILTGLLDSSKLP